MKNHIKLIIIFLSTFALNGLRVVPLTGEEYVGSLGYGFDTDIFKNSPPLRKYNNSNNQLVEDLKKMSVGHLRLRSRADIFGFKTRNYDSASMMEYLESLETVLNDLIRAGIFPVISWINHEAQSNPTAADEANFVHWWRMVAESTKNYTYELSFNLITEINRGPLRQIAVYNSWTEKAVAAIRSAGGNNKDRIIILPAPGKVSSSLFKINPAIYANSNKFVAEWHLYASGPTKDGGNKNWAGNGSLSDRMNVDSIMDDAVSFTNNTNVPTWIGAWMPYDNIGASQDQEEVETFACYFATAAFKRGIPWAMNKLDNFYDTKFNVFIQNESIGRFKKRITLNLPRILNASLCALLNNHKTQTINCQSSCLSQKCQESAVSGSGFSQSCTCRKCSRPCPVSRNSTCFYPLDACLKIDEKNTCYTRDDLGNGKWEECVTEGCPEDISAAPLSLEEIQNILIQTNI